MMKILFLISGLSGGGAERAVSNITLNLPNDVESTILLNRVTESDYPTKAKICTIGLKKKFQKNILFQIKLLVKRIICLQRMKKSGEYDACISFMDSANMANVLTRNKGCRTILSVRVDIKSDKTIIYRFFVAPMVKVLYNRADKIVAVSEGIKESLIHDFHIVKEKIEVITNGFDIKRIHSLAEESVDNIEIEEFMKDSFIYVAVGRLNYQKAHWHLIRAFSDVAEKCEDAKLIIIGDGAEKEYLESLIDGYHLPDRIQILPFQKNPFKILARCQVYVMPSMFEGYSNALCEALICGLPCIATDFQTSAREILAPDTQVSYQNVDRIEFAKYGILTPVCTGQKYRNKEPLEKQEQMIAEAMEKLYNDQKMLEGYAEMSQERAKSLEINTKIQEWINLVETINKD